MNRRPSLRCIAVVASYDSPSAVATIAELPTTAAAAMPFRDPFVGGHPQGRRRFSNKPLDPTSSEFVSGDSHFHSVRDVNRSFRPSYHAVPPPPYYGTGLEVHGHISQPHRPVTHAPHQLHGPRPRPYRSPWQGGQSFGNHQPFRPHQLRQTQEPRTGASKPRPPDYREWEYARPGPAPHCERFTVLSYNILADYLATDHWDKLYFHIPRHIMDWNWRKRNISFELKLWSADILCFQEVDRFQDLEAELRPHGYNGIWKMRTGDAVDGCAIFWRVSRFKLMHEESIEYNKLGLRDNVAQICVLETQNGHLESNGASNLSTSSASSNRVVICNIHVLFNPKRGEMKLGQIRVLLERAHAISKLWDDAPVVICGDFNCIPKSPMYYFISEQKLDLSGLARDKVSGQASAEIRPSWHTYPPYYRKEAANGANQASAVNCDKIQCGDSPSDAKNLACHNGSGNFPSTGIDAESRGLVIGEISESCIQEEHGNGSSKTNGSPSHETTDTFVSDSRSTQCIPHPLLNENPTTAHDDTKSPSLPENANEITSLELSLIHSETTGLKEYVDSNSQTSLKPLDNHMKNFFSPQNHPSDLAKTSESKRNYVSDVSQLNGSSDKLFPKSLDIDSSKQVEAASSVLSSAATDNHGTHGSSYAFASADFRMDGKFKNLSINEVFDGPTDELGEDCNSFLFELNNSGQSPLPNDLDSSSPRQASPSHGENEIFIDTGNSFSSRSAWTPAEMQIATGSEDSKVMEHPLKLKSAYTDVENTSGLRDSNGEPLVTSYHRRFSGTVDYIWRSEGLQTAKVLAPIPKHVMQQCRGFPTKKWGSDHIALVAELTFTRDVFSQKASQR